MRLLTIRVMLYMARFELGLAVIGGNRHRVRLLRKDVQHWESKLCDEQVRIWIEGHGL